MESAAYLGLVFCAAGLVAVLAAAIAEAPRRNSNRRRR